MKKIISILLASVLLFSGCGGKDKMGSSEKVLATSGDDKIYAKEFLYNLGAEKNQLEYELAQYGFTEADFPAYWETEFEEGRTTADDVKEYALENTKIDYVFTKLGKAEGLSYDKAVIKEFETSLENFIIQLNSKEKTGERAYYEHFYITQEETVEVVKDLSIGDAYKEKVKNEIEITDEEIKEYYENNIDDYEEITVAHILVKLPEDASEDDKAEKKELAEKVLERAINGEEFGELAVTYSEDEGSAANNGEYTITRNTTFVPEFMEWSWDESREVGDLEIVETDYGYHIMKFVKFHTFDDVKEDVKNYYLNSILGEKLMEIYEENKLEWEVDQEFIDEFRLYPEVEETEETTDGDTQEEKKDEGQEEPAEEEKKDDKKDE